MVVDPKRQFASPNVGMGNNPIQGIDIDGGRVWYWQFVAGFGLGWFRGAAVELKVGNAIDDFGRVHYELASALELNDKGNGHTDGEWYIGADIGANTGFGLNQAASFIDILDQRIISGGGALPFGGGGEIGSLGVGSGISVRSMQEDGIRFIAFTSKEIRNTTGSFLDYTFDLWSVRQGEDGNFYLNFINKRKWYESDIQVYQVAGHKEGYQTKG